MSSQRPHRPLHAATAVLLALSAATCGPIDIGSVRQLLEVTSIDAGRGGNRDDPLRVFVGTTQAVHVDVKNIATTQLRGILVTLVFRRGTAEIPASETTITVAGERDLEPGESARFAFTVVPTESAMTGAWTVSAAAMARAVSGRWEAATARQKQWSVERAPIVVGPFTPARTFGRGYASINRDCPLLLQANVKNAGEQVALLTAQPTAEPPADALIYQYAPATISPHVQGDFEGELELDPRRNISSGQRREIRISVSARTGDRAQRIDVAQSFIPPLLVVESGARLDVVDIGPGSGAEPRVATPLEVRVNVVFRTAMGGATAVDDAKVALRITRADMSHADVTAAWQPMPDASHSPTRLSGCDQDRPTDCGRAQEYRFTMVPQTPGVFRVDALVTATEQLAPPLFSVELCGQSGLQPGSSLLVDVR